MAGTTCTHTHSYRKLFFCSSCPCMPTWQGQPVHIFILKAFLLLQLPVHAYCLGQCSKAIRVTCIMPFGQLLLENHLHYLHHVFLCEPRLCHRWAYRLLCRVGQGGGVQESPKPSMFAMLPSDSEEEEEAQRLDQAQASSPSGRETLMMHTTRSGSRWDGAEASTIHERESMALNTAGRRSFGRTAWRTRTPKMPQVGGGWLAGSLDF
jgi:hypothetical protein